MTMRLTDLFMELIAYVAYFNKSAAGKPRPYEQVNADILRLMTDIENAVARGHFNQEDFEMAQFAVVAWINETILSSDWQDKDKWRTQPLQLKKRTFNMAIAGEKFFKYLNAIGPHQREVREIYYLCLAMGFKGQYHHEGDDFLLDQLKTSNLKTLLGSSVGIPSLENGDLFPEAYPAETETTSASRTASHMSKFTLVCFGIPVALFAGLYLIYTFILSNVGDNLFKF